MRKLLTILLVLLTVISFGQLSPNAPVFQRATPGNTVMDARLLAQYNLYIPRYPDTVAANVPSNIAIDTIGAIIFTYDVNAVWVRVCCPKHWERVQGAQALPDGVYSGGDVGWTGTGLDFFETAAIYILNGVPITSPTVIPISLVPSDPTFGRIDLIGLGPTGPTVITGVPASSPQEPSYNPQTFIRRAAVLVEAGALTPAITTNVVFDENLGLPDEWTPSNTGGTVDFANTLFPYHLTIAAHITALDSSNRIKFNYSDTINSAPRGSLVGFIRLATTMALNQNLYFQLYNAGLPVSLQLPFTSYGGFRGITAQYQPIFFPLPSFGASNIIFDEIRIIPTGGGAFPVMDIDFLQFQTGFSPIVTKRDFGVEDNFGYSSRLFDFNNYDFRFNNINKFVSTVSPVSDSAYTIRTTTGIDLFRVNAFNNTAYVYQLSAGLGTFSVDAAAARISGASHFMQFNSGSYIEPFVQPLYIKSPYPMSSVIGIYLQNNNFDVAPNDSTLYKPIQADWTSEDGTSRTKWFIRADGAQWVASMPHTATADTFMVWKNGFHQGMTLSEIQSLIGGGSVTSVATNNGTGITGGTITASGTLAIDTTVISTKNNVLAQIQANGSFRNSNIGVGYRLAIPNTNDIKTLGSGYSLSYDSTTTSNVITLTIDTTLMATRAWAQSIAGGGGFTGVTSVSGVNTNGFSFSIANPTSTPTITLSTSITGMLKGNGTAISAATSGTDYSAGTSGLATGIVKSTTGTGNLTIAVAGTDYVIPSVSSLSSLAAVGILTSGSISTGFVVGGVTMTLGSDAAYDLYYRNASGVLTRLGNGTTGQFLGANTGGAPSWQTPTVTAGVTSITGTANQVIASASTGAVTLSLPQSIATTSTPTFRSLTLGGTAATTPLTFVTNTDATAAAGRWYYNTTRLGFSLASTILRVPLTNDVTPSNGQIPIGNGTNYTVAAIAPTDNSTVVNNGAGSISIGPNKTFQTLTDGATITWNAANGFNARVTLGAAGRTLARSNWVNGQTYTLIVIQDGTGSRTITTWPTGTIWPGGLAPVLPTAANSKTIISFIFDGTNCYGAYTNQVYQ